MTEFYLGSFFLLLLAFAFLYLPLKQYKHQALGLFFLLVLASGLMYSYLGDAKKVMLFSEQQKKVLKAKALLKTYKDPKEVIEKMQMHLVSHPESAKGWYLLGRLYLADNQSQKAMMAFNKAYQLKPDDRDIAFQYVQTKYQKNNYLLTKNSQLILQNLLTKSPNDLEILSFTAMVDFQNKNYQKAIENWQHLLELMPEPSQDRSLVLKAIAKAEKKQMQEG